MNKESKIEACAILAQDYVNIAKTSGIKSEEVFKDYMDRCMTRNEEMIAEQVMKEAFKKTQKDSGISWVTEWNKERNERKAIEKKYNTLTKLLNNKENKDYLTSYAVNGMEFL